MLYRLKVLEGSSGKVGVVDACLAGGSPGLGAHEVMAEELVAGKYVNIPLLIDHPGGKIETRVNWDGNASIAVDCITLFKIE